MEDIFAAKAVERSAVANNETPALQAQWLEQQQPQKLELARGKQGADGPGKDVADRLDKELRDFANTKLNGSSAEMQQFQQLVNKFEDSANKKQAVEDFGPAAAKLRVSMENDALKTYNKLEAEAAKDAGRKPLQDTLAKQQDAFFDRVQALPSKEQERVLNLMEFEAGESLEHRDERVRDGIAKRPGLLKAFNNMEATQEKIEARKSPTEKALESRHDQDVREARTIWSVVQKVAIRSEINT